MIKEKISNAIISYRIKLLSRSNKKYYIIIQLDTDETCGMFALIRKIIGGIEFAIAHNAISVVDLKTYPNCMQCGDNCNGWENYFEQPFNLSLDELDTNVTRIYHKDCWGPALTMDLFTNEYAWTYYRKLFSKYIRIKPELLKHFSDEKERILNKGKYLGILARGTDYNMEKTKWHPIQPNVEELLNKTRELFQHYNIDGIFLATEDAGIFNQYITEFGDKVKYIEQKRYSSSISDYICLTDIYKSNQHKQNLAYLTSLYILSKCDYFIGGINGGTFGAMLLSDGFEYTYFWNKGVGKISDEEYYKSKKL